MEKSNGKKRHILRNTMISIFIVIAVLAIVVFVMLKNSVLISFPELKGSPEVGEWYAITPEEAKSSDGSEWNGFIRLGSENKVMVYFFGGGASINEYTAAHPKDFYADVVKNQDFVAKMGIASDTEDNPFKDWTILVLPYSTGDFHSGTGEYAYSDDKGNSKTLYHYGYTNFSLFMKEAVKYTGTPDTLLVTGFSAGGFGTSLLADDVIDYYPSTSNVTVAVDSSLLLTDDWQDISENVWKSPQPISERLNTDNIVLDSLTALSDKRGDSVKILFDSSVRDGELAKWQAYLDHGEMSATDKSGDVFQSNLKAMVEGLQNNIPGVGIYIWDGLSYNKKLNLTQHTIISSNVFDKLNGKKSISDWILDAVNGDVHNYGIELLEKEY
ncbi:MULTISPECIES: pectin acetylesterase-family hydrolase [Paenibacillus]|uniref:Pectin acetylesterase-family hydrolase n=1 Tax=Paenibacillus illinoisensis TaxID=59845 RepID=A0ABW8HSI9_9BACL|nr:pectin acetylesterase-family hydrolase [Paenibacillus pabuli]MEC0125515.1 pectin acetylesterase-family hydrolase [Paenibacillus pabuli]UOK61368.1 pectin acetylesterase-family hydrolase [Paenibacillus sp. OVF10]